MESAKLLADPDRPVFDILFNEALHLATTAPGGIQIRVSSPKHERNNVGIEKIWRAQDQLKRKIVDSLPDLIRVAAAQGLCSADVLVFGGGDKFKVEGTNEEFPLLFLLKGPTDPEQKQKLASEGFLPLLEVLRRDVAPFDLRHSWTVGTNVNKLTVSWRPSM